MGCLHRAGRGSPLSKAVLCEGQMQLNFSLRRTAQRADVPRLFGGVHVPALAADPQHRSVRRIEGAVLERLKQVAEDDPMVALHPCDLLEFERNLRKPLFPCDLCKGRINIFRLRKLVLHRKLQVVFKRSRMKGVVRVDMNVVAASRILQERFKEHLCMIGLILCDRTDGVRKDLIALLHRSFCRKLVPHARLTLSRKSSCKIVKGLRLGNTVGVVDADYYHNPDNGGHILICMQTTNQKVSFAVGDKIAQGIIKQYFLVDDDAAKGVREGGFGSTGN